MCVIVWYTSIITLAKPLPLTKACFGAKYIKPIHSGNGRGTSPVFETAKALGASPQLE